ncbi:hypothetical protein [Paenibacillus sp. GYB003]|jgi:hypothetical protein|uniref:hypothetical protein n=1 Tax=Paenibacillus sp. GYB003 TaxID=2994392 RepID=UPI002F9613A8
MWSLAQTLAARRPLQSLKPAAVWNAELDAAIAAQADEWVGRLAVGSKSDALSFIAGLHAWNDSLDASHDISQNVETETGSYWHGIMHRMEGDYWNSKYWMKRVGRHPIFPELHRAAAELLSGPSGLAALDEGPGKDLLKALAKADGWDPYLFVDAVERQTERERDERTAYWLRSVQWHEIRLLLRHCYRGATGEEPPALGAGNVGTTVFKPIGTDREE